MKELNFPYHFLNHTPWNAHGSALWPASTFSLRRNLARYPFPHKQTKTQAHHVLEELKEVFFNHPDIQNPMFLDFSLLTLQQKEFLLEHFFVPDGVFEDRPHQGLITDSSGTFLAGINLCDHLTLQMVDFTNSWHKTWNHLQAIESSMGKHLDYAFSNQFGYLTSDMHHCGTGLSIRAYLHLPAILHGETLELFHSTEEDCHMAPIGGKDETKPFQGDVVVLENKYSLGVSEDHLLKQVYSTANKLINSEKEQRLALQSHDSSTMKDLVSRSFGILLHSYQLPTQEALGALSLLKLGVDVGWVEGLSDAQINNLFFKCRKGHLLAELKEDLSQEALLHKRAEFIHSALKDARLVI